MNKLTANNHLLEVKGLAAHIQSPAGTLHILNGVGFHVDREECFGIIGESGSGKTMTAMAVLRYAEHLGLEIAGGEILFEGRDVMGFGKRELRAYNGAEVAVIPQDPMSSFDPLFTIESQLHETVRAFGGISKSESARRIRDTFSALQISEEKLKCYPFQLSGGMLQRIAGAAAVCRNPRLIIADEPTTALDVTVQLEYLRLLKRIQKDYKTAIIFISHDIHAVSMLCDRIAVMYGGRIVETADRRELLENPAHPYTKALISLANITGEARESYDTIDGSPPSPIDEPVGCTFAGRCPYSERKCFSEKPESADIGAGGHTVHCWRFV